MPSRVDERLAVAQSRGMPPPAFTVEEDMGPVGDAGPLVPCPTCGRSFNQLAHAKHVKVCEKVFVKKRKAFNTAAVRVAGTEASKFFDAKRGQPKMDAVKAADRAGSARRGASAASGVGGARARSVASKVPKWKAQSEQLRLAMRNNRTLAAAAAAGRDVRTVELESVPDQLDDRVPCPHCGRKFAALTAERHIPKCKDTVAKPTFQRAKAGTGAYARR